MSLADEIASADVLLDMPGTLTPRTLTPAERKTIVAALRSALPEERTLGGWPLVKRYSQLGSGMVSTFEGPNRIPSGDWVAASDYDRLLQLAVDLEYRATNAEAASSPLGTLVDGGLKEQRGLHDNSLPKHRNQK